MFSVKTIVISLAAVALCLAGFMTDQARTVEYCVGGLFIVIIVSAYLIPSRRNVFFVFFSVIAVMALGLHRGRSVHEMIVLAAVMWLSPSFIRISMKMGERSIKALDIRAARRREQFIDFQRQKESLDSNKILLENQIARLSKVYDISKKMSQELSFGDVLNIFEEFMRDNFTYAILRFFVNESHGEDGLSGEISEFSFPENGTRSVVIHKAGSPLIKTLAQYKQTVFLEQPRHAGELAKLAVLPQTAGAIVCCLRIERGSAAYMILENVDRSLTEIFSIIAGQVSLQLKKVFLYEYVRRLSIRDGLTGAFRRHYFMTRLEEEIKRSLRLGLNFSLLMIDVDDFKACNDMYGHLVGDAVLKRVAELMNREIREVDLLSRYGGEEFVIMLPETGCEGAVSVAERMRRAVAAERIRAFDERIAVTLSIGGALFPQDGNDLGSLLQKADIQLYAAKKKGKNRVCFAPDTV